MIDDRPLSADRVPTLTEVVELDLQAPPTARTDPAEGAGETDAIAAADGPAAMPAEEAADAATAAEAPAAQDAGTAAPAPPDDFVLVGLDTHEAVAGIDADAESAALPSGADGPEATTIEANGPAAEPAAAPASSVAVEALPAAAALGVDVDAVVGQALAELMPRIDMLLESRLREALAPALARAADGLIRDTREPLAAAVRDLVHEAVDRALQRRADR